MGKILIVEDEIVIRSGLVQIAKKYNTSLNIVETGLATEALKIAMSERIDAFFLDIQLEDYSGLELAKKIREVDCYKFTPIIFITAMYSRELEAFRNIHCYDYIIKPFSEEEITRVFQEVITNGIIPEKVKPIIKIKEKGYTYILNQEDLIYIESRNRKLFVKTIYEEMDISSQTLAKFSEELADNFIQCHKSFIVNTSFVTKIDKINNLILVLNKPDSIPIGRKYKDNVWELTK